ncbi:hypothetical protein GOP47_0027984 [Adiantum capillus-veneris]|nr:hypothetical protein GOP47_0027984 [Adiantum capillus-veneris]
MLIKLLVLLKLSLSYSNQLHRKIRVISINHQTHIDAYVSSRTHSLFIKDKDNHFTNMLSLGLFTQRPHLTSSCLHLYTAALHAYSASGRNCILLLGYDGSLIYQCCLRTNLCQRCAPLNGAVSLCLSDQNSPTLTLLPLLSSATLLRVKAPLSSL